MYIDKAYVIQIRRELHQIPEIEFDLPKTLAVIRRELETIGLPYTEQYGKSSIIATLNEGKGNKTIALRADMDALPITEQTGLPFSSTHPGNMHACGHDCHTAMLLGAAKALKAMESQIQCCIKFVFQASEEGPSGAKLICDDGFMEQIDMIIGCHVMPDMPSGTVLISKECANASCHNFSITIDGKSCHVARPHQGIDAIAMANRIYSDIQIMRAREMDPFQPVVIGIGTIHGGNASNVVCERVVMEGSVRALKQETDDTAVSRMRSICESISKDTGGTAQFNSVRFTPCVTNHPQIRDALITAAEEVAGTNAVLERPVSMGSEDFAFYLQHKPGAMFSLGVAPEGKPIIPLHNGKMIVDENALDTGANVFVQFVLDQMRK